MLTKLHCKGLEIGIFQLCSMKDLDKSCTKDALVEVIDFDKTKEVIFNLINRGNDLKMNQYKSCDALKIMPEIDHIDFIEIKGIKDFCEKIKGEKQEVASKTIHKQTEKFDLESKIEESLDVFKLILQIGKIDLTKHEKNKILNTITKDYIVVIDEEIERDGSMVFAATLDYLSHSSDYTDEVIIKLREQVDGIMNIKINRTLIISQSKIDDYYSKKIS